MEKNTFLWWIYYSFKVQTHIEYKEADSVAVKIVNFVHGLQENT